MVESVLSPKGLLYCHYRIVERIGGRHGVRDIEMLRSALARPIKKLNNKELFPAPFAKAAVLMHALIVTTPFHDGNWPTAFAAAVLLLAEAGYQTDVDPCDIKEVIAGVMQGRVSWQDLADWLQANSRGSEDNAVEG